MKIITLKVIFLFQSVFHSLPHCLDHYEYEKHNQVHVCIACFSRLVSPVSSYHAGF